MYDISYEWDIQLNAFRRDFNADGLDGRQAFFLALFKKLSKEQQLQLLNWDTGHY